MKAQLEINQNILTPNDTFTAGSNAIMITPDINEDYWAYRVKVSKTQSIVGFPKFGCIGIGFAVEDKSWNTNLPSDCEAEKIYKHIRCNKGAKHITKLSCIIAIKIIQYAVMEAKRRER